MAAAGELRIGVVVDHDAVRSPQQHHGHGRGGDGVDGGLAGSAATTPIGPMLVEDQSKAAMSVFISLSGIGVEAGSSRLGPFAAY